LRERARNVAALRANKFIETRADMFRRDDKLTLRRKRIHTDSSAQKIGGNQNADKIRQRRQRQQHADKHRAEFPRRFICRRAGGSRVRFVRFFAQRPQQQQHHRRRNRRVGDVENWKSSNGYKIHHITQPQAVNEVAHRAADNQTNRQTQQPTRFGLGTIKPYHRRQNQKGRKGEHDAELRKVTARRACVVRSDNAEKIETRDGIPGVAHADILYDQKFGELVQRQDYARDQSDPQRARFPFGSGVGLR